MFGPRAWAFTSMNSIWFQKQYFIGGGFEKTAEKLSPTEAAIGYKGEEHRAYFRYLFKNSPDKHYQFGVWTKAIEQVKYLQAVADYKQNKSLGSWWESCISTQFKAWDDF